MHIPEISVDELADRLSAGARLIDVREPGEFAEARVPQAELMPLDTVAARAGEFNKDDTIYLICRSGARSLFACQQLAAVGLEVVNVAGGTIAWVESGREIASGIA